MKLKAIGNTSTNLCTIDDEIVKLEALIESQKISQMCTVALEPVSPGVSRVHVMPMGGRLPVIRDMLFIALQEIEALIPREGELQ